MPYKLKDVLVLIVAEATGAKIATVYRVVEWVTMLTIRAGRKSSGTSDKTPR